MGPKKKLLSVKHNTQHRGSDLSDTGSELDNDSSDQSIHTEPVHPQKKNPMKPGAHHLHSQEQHGTEQNKNHRISTVSEISTKSFPQMQNKHGPVRHPGKNTRKDSHNVHRTHTSLDQGLDFPKTKQKHGLTHKAKETTIDIISSDDSVSTSGVSTLTSEQLPSGNRSNIERDKERFTKFLFKDDHTPTTMDGCPRGMTALIKEDIIYLNPVYQFEGGMISSHISASRFEVLNSTGHQIYYVGQKTNCCSRFVIYSSQLFKATFFDMAGHKSFEVHGPTCFLHMNVTSAKVVFPNGDLIGEIKTTRSCRANYNVLDDDGNPALTVKGPKWCPKSYDNFSISLPNTTHEIGTISKSWKLAHLGDAYVDFETAGVSFLPGMDVKLKALALGALIFIEFQWYNKHTKFSPLVIGAVLLISLLIMGIILSPLLFDDDPA